jgi:ubiquinone biosynthesis protein COQ9
MAEAAKTPKPKTKRKSAGRDETSLRFAVVDAALPHIPFDGFTDKVLQGAALEAGLEKRDIPRLFPNGPLSLVEAYSEQADHALAEKLAKMAMGKMKIRERIAAAVKTRLAILRPHKEAARRAAAFLTLPPNAPRAAALLYRTVDLMWRAAGDTSTDFNFYTKRAILAGVYSTTLMRWFTDDSEDESATEEFLAHRINDVMRFEKLKARVRERAKHLPSLSDIFRGPSTKRN